MFPWHFKGITLDSAGLPSSFELVDYISVSTGASNLHSQETEYYSATLKNAMKLEGDSDAPRRRSQQPEASASFENLESLPADEEVIGIITLEDVMEELLQVDVNDNGFILPFVDRNLAFNSIEIIIFK